MLSRKHFRSALWVFCYRHHRSLVTRSLPSKHHGDEDEWSSQPPQYPVIQDLSFRAKKNRELKLWHNKIARLSTVEEKLFEINMPKYYGYKSHILTDQKFPYNTKPFIQYATRTSFQQGLPLYYDQLKLEANQILESIQTPLKDAISLQLAAVRSHSDVNPSVQQELATKSLILQLNRTITNALATKFNHLQHTETDFDPRHEAFWFLGGISPPKLVSKIKQGVAWQKEYANDPYDRNIQYLGNPYLAVRHRHPLEPLLSKDLEAFDVQPDDGGMADIVPNYRYDPLALGYGTDFRHATTVPGFWPGDEHEFGLLSFQRMCTPRKIHATTTGTDMLNAEAASLLDSQGILSSFAWLLGQACYQGFSVFNDITYPLTTQTVLTDGKYWSFYAYQLNTVLLHSDQVNTNKRYNLCWGTTAMPLYESIDENGNIYGLNKEVLSQLVMFYINQPRERLSVNLKPHLCSKETTIAQIEDENRRVFLQQAYQHLVSNRPRHRLVPEVYQWEKIYKIDHKTRPMDPKRRPFEFGDNVYSRRMDEHALKYIPRAVRPGGPKSRPKFEATYYPTVRRQ